MEFSYKTKNTGSFLVLAVTVMFTVFSFSSVAQEVKPEVSTSNNPDIHLQSGANNSIPDSLIQIIQNNPDTIFPWMEQRVGESVDKSKLPGNRGAKATEISVDKNKYTIEELVQEVLVTGCLQAYNIEYSGDPNNGIGFFSSNGSAFPLDSGIIISTGNVANMVGPNSSSSYSDDIGGTADSDLSLLNGGNSGINDAQILEFDFIPAGDIVQFNFMFASDEYEEYFCSRYNDKFGFILSGPGINGSYSNNGENIAKLPDGTIVSINTVGPSYCWRTGVNNSDLYNNSTNLYLGTEFDGSTVILTAEAQVQACEVYHIRMIINDYLDSWYDSGVFLEANSFSSNDVEITAYGNGVIGSTELYEGCTYDSLIIQRVGDDNSQELNVGLSYNPSEMNYADIRTMSGDSLPSEVTLPPGVDTYVLRYYAVDDGNQEPAETETFTMTFYTGCPCDPEPTSVALDFVIYDPIYMDSLDISATNVECSGQSNGVILVNPLGGSGTYEYKLDSGPWQYSNTFTGLTQGTYTVTVRDSIYEKNCQSEVSVDSIRIQEPEPIEAKAGSDVTICYGLSTTLEGSGGAQFSWSPSDWLNDPNIASPTVTPTGVTNTPVSKTYTLTTTDENGHCPDTDQVTIIVNPTPDASIQVNGSVVSEINVCPDDNTVLQALVSPATTTTTTNYSWSTGETTSSITVSPNSSQTYGVSAENEYGCSENESVQILVYPFEVVSSVDADPICPEEVDGVVTISVDGHSGNLPVTVDVTGPGSYSQQLTFTEANPDPQQLTNLGIGTYSATGTSSAPAACSSTATFEIQSTDNLPPVLTYKKAGDTAVVVVIPSGTSGYVSVPTPNTNDNCNYTFENDYNNNTSANGTYPLGKTTVTWTAIDDSNNEATPLKQNVYVIDASEFSITCPSPTAMDLGYNPDIGDFVEDLGEVTTTSGSILYSLVSLSSVLGPEESDPSAGSCGFMRTRTYTAEWCFLGIPGFACQYESCERVYHYIKDSEPPTITCSATQVETSPLNQTSMNITLIDPTVSDNCSAMGDITVVGVRSDGLPLSDPYPLGYTTITYTATDEAGNESTCDHIIHVKSSSSPTDPEGLVLWLKANAGVYLNDDLASHGENVSLWDDHFLNNDAVQTTSGNRPKFRSNNANMINYNPVVYFNGTDRYLVSPLETTGLESENTVFFIVKPQTDGAVVGIGQNSYIGFDNNGIIYSVNNGASVTKTTSGSYSSNEVKVVSVIKSGNSAGDIAIFLNGVQATNAQNGSALITGASDTRIGTGDPAGSDFLQARIAEVIIYNKVLTASQRQEVESYLAVKYGITLDE